MLKHEIKRKSGETFQKTIKVRRVYFESDRHLFDFLSRVFSFFYIHTVAFVLKVLLSINAHDEYRCKAIEIFDLCFISILRESYVCNNLQRSNYQIYFVLICSLHAFLKPQLLIMQ